MLTLADAVVTLSKLQTAAPPATAGKLAEVIAMIESLSSENAYLNTLLIERQTQFTDIATEENATSAGMEPIVPLPPLTGDPMDTRRLRPAERSSDSEQTIPLPAPLADPMATHMLPGQYISAEDETPSFRTPAESMADRLLTGNQRLAATEPSPRVSPADPMSTRMLTQQQRLAEPPPVPRTDSGATRMIASSPEILASLSGSSASDDEIWPHLNETLYPILHVIRQQVEKMQDVETGLLNQDQIEALAVIDDNAGSAAAALNSLALYRALRAGVSLNPTPLDCAELLNAAHVQVASQAERKGHGLIVHPADSLPAVSGDPEQSLGILCDMLENAIAYTPFGGEIQLSAENLGDHVLFNVVDNGIGLSAEDMEQIGQPFWRGLRSLLVRSHPGIGLRLYLAREILTRQGGDLIFSGEPDVGSTFSFILPVAR